MSEKLWPDTEPPDKTDPYWEFNNNCTINGNPYWKVEVSPSKWQWQINKHIATRLAAAEQRRRNLYQALRTRILTDAELKEALGYGDRLNIEPMVPFMETEKMRQLNDAFRQQQLLQLQARDFERETR